MRAFQRFFLRMVGAWCLHVEYAPMGQAFTPSTPVDAPTAAGYSMLNGMSGLSATNLKILQQYVPAAPVANALPTSVLGARKAFEIRVDAANAFNHAQFTPGLLNSVKLTTYNSGDRTYLEPQTPTFQGWSQVFPSNARSVQLAAHIFF